MRIHFKTKWLILLFLIFGLLILNANTTKADDYKKVYLSDLTSEQCFSLVQGYLPNGTPDDNLIFKNSIYEMICFYEQNPFYDGCFSSPYIEELNHIVQSFVLDYYEIDSDVTRDEQTRENGQLLYNTLVEPYDNRHAKYNCYAYAIDRYESDNYYNCPFKFQPGEISEVEFEDYEVPYYFLTLTLQELAECIQDELELIGYKNVHIYDAMPSVLDDNQKLICVRRGPGDYHLMRYDKDTNYWYHKPGATAVLRYNYPLSNDEEWWHEYVDQYGVHQTNYFYSGTIKYITYYNDELGISCSSYNESIDCDVIAKKDHIVKLFVECEGQYNFVVSANDPINVHFYDYLYINQIIDFDNDDQLNFDEYKEFSFYLDKGVYYIRVDFDGDSYSGDINICISSDDFDEVNLNVSNDLTLHIHDRGDSVYHAHGKYLVSSGSNIYKISLECKDYNNNVVSVPANSINVFSNSMYDCLMDRFSEDIDLLTQNLVNEASIFVFLENGYYYFSINLPNNNYSSVKLYVVPLLINEANQFDNSILSQCPLITLMSNVSDYYSSFVTIDIEQTGKFSLSVNYSLLQNAKIVIFKEYYDSLLNKKYLDLIMLDNLYSNLTSYNRLIDITDGRYYIGYIEKGNGSINSMTIQRYIDNNVISFYNCLMIDPGEGYICGSQINLLEADYLNKSYNSHNIVEGFTRIIYLSLDYTLDISRLDYYWYSSNESILEVTPYGTVLAKPVNANSSAYVMAVNKNDPSVVYMTEFLVVNDLEDYQSSPIDINVYMSVEPEQLVYINLSNVVVPINLLQLYDWSTNNASITLYSFGRFIADDSLSGYVGLIEGVYYYNSRVHIHVYVNVQEE